MILYRKIFKFRKKKTYSQSWEESKFCEKYNRCKKKKFNENIENEIINSLHESFRIGYVL